jgi:hypothetical protein
MRVPKHPLERRATVTHGSVHVQHGDDVEGVFDKRAKIFLATLERFHRALALGRVPHCADQQLSCDLPLYKVVLGALTNRLDGELFVIQSGKDNDGHTGSLRMSPDQRLQTICIRQRQVEHDDVKIVRIQFRERLCKCVDVSELDVGAFSFTYHFPKQPGIARVVFHEEYTYPVQSHHSIGDKTLFSV